MNLLVAVLTWYGYIVGAGIVAVAFRSLLEARNDRRARAARRPVVLFLDVPPADDRPRKVQILRADGTVIHARPSRETVVHGEGSDWS